MSDLREEQARQQAGAEAQAALRAISSATARRIEEILSQADELHRNGNLTLPNAHTLMVAILEQRRTEAALAAAALAGERAGRRIARVIDRQAEAEERAKRARTHGQNRFFRSRVAAVDAET